MGELGELGKLDELGEVGGPSLVRSCLLISLMEGRKSRGALLKGVQLGRWVGGVGR